MSRARDLADSADLTFDGDTLKIDSANNRVGIGTDSPDVALNVAGYARVELGSVPKLQLKRTGNTAGNGYIECLGSDDSVDYKISFGQSGTEMGFHLGGSERMRIDSSGNVGISTSSPDTALNIERSYTGGLDANYPSIYLTNTASAGNGSTTFNQASLKITSGSTTGLIRAANDTGGPYGTNFDIWGTSNNPMRFATNNTERMRIDSSGNVGIGTSSPSSDNGTTVFAHIGSSSKAAAGLVLQDDENKWEIISNGNLSIADGATERMRIGSTGCVSINNTTNQGKLNVAHTAYGAYFTETGGSSSVGIALGGFSGAGHISTNTAVPMTFDINGTERMRINSSGNVSITSADTSKQYPDVLKIETTSTSDIHPSILFEGNRGGATKNAKITMDSGTTAGSGMLRYYSEREHIFYRAFNGSSGTESMRVDVSGNLCVGTTSTVTGERLAVESGHGGAVATFNRTDNIDANNRDMILFRRGATGVGAIWCSNTSTTYVTSSDYRLKTDVQPMTGATERLKALNPVNFEWIANGTRVDGFLAHEAQEVVPEAVTGTKDAVDAEGKPDYQGIDQSKLVPLLVATVQEQQAVIESLTARIEALES